LGAPGRGEPTVRRGPPSATLAAWDPARPLLAVLVLGVTVGLGLGVSEAPTSQRSTTASGIGVTVAPTTTAPGLTPPTTTPAPPNGVASVRCEPDQLQLAEAALQPSPETQQHPLLLTLTNVGSSACSLDGYPGISLFDGRGDLLPLDYRWGGDQEVTAAPPQRVGLPSGGVAYVLLNKSSCVLGDLSDATTVALIPPDDTTTMTLSLRGGALGSCGDAPASAGTLSISPVEPSPAAAFSV
jgi:Protein of unknown function (DUF4232)